MNLKPLTIDDIEIFEKYYKISGYEGYNSNFVTMFMWDHEYHVHYYANEHFLVALCHYEHLLFWNMPLTTKEYFKEAIDFMWTYSKEHDLPFYIDGVLNEQTQWLNEIYGNKLIYTKQRGEYDYIYEREMLLSLSGKKMQKRRNHYNAFCKEYENRWHYRSLEKKDKEEVLHLLENWSINKAVDSNITNEKAGIIALIEAMEELPIKIGCIEIDGKIEAFIIGSMLNHETLQIHVEKANTQFRGLYVAILKSFLEREFQGAKWINREDDMNLESLRKAKVQLHPIQLIEKSFIYPNQVIYRPSKPEDFSQLVNAWKNNFKEDSEEYIHDYFKTFYQKENTWVAEIDHMIVSVVHLRPLNIQKNHQICQARYIEGVSTHFMFRHQGYMKTLLLTALKKTPCDFFLLQAYQWEVYDFLNFADYTYKAKVVMDTLFECLKPELALQNEMNPQAALHLYQQMTSHLNGYALRTLEDMIHLKKTMEIEGQHYLGTLDAYLIYQIINKQCVILEAVSLNQEALYPLLNQLIVQYGLVTALLEEQYCQGIEYERILFLKAKANAQEVPVGNIYFNEYI